MICVDSIDADSWYARWKHPADRAARHIQYENYLLDEVLPLSRQLNANPFFMTTGASFGAYHAVNFVLRHPELVGRTIGLSVVYDISQWTDGYHDDNIYFNNPMAFISNENDWGRLESLRGIDIIIVSGADDPLRNSSEDLSTILWDKEIGNALRIWDGWSHDWPWWRQMIVQYIGGHD